MSYQKHFTIADDVIDHLASLISEQTDPFISSRYIGFISVSAVAVYELALKEIFIDFAEKKHKVFGTYTKNHFNKINGKIKNSHIKEDYIRKFGDKYLNRYKKKLIFIDSESMKTKNKSISGSYDNLITWRNSFAHGGEIPNTPTFNETVESYKLGKELIKCVADTMTR